MLKQEYKDGVTLQEAKTLSIKILAKTLDTTKLSPDKLEVATVTRDGQRTKMTVLKHEELVKLIAEHERIEKEEEAQKKREADSKSDP